MVFGLMDINEAGVIKLSQELGAENSMAHVMDVVDRSSWTRAIDAFGTVTNGRMHLFFDNAGIVRTGNFEAIREAEAAQIININLTGVIHGIYACRPMLAETSAQEGKTFIVNTSSIARLMPLPGGAVYTASKFAVRGLTEALNVEFEHMNIQVSSVMPYFTNTAMMDEVSISSNQPMRNQLAEGQVTLHTSLSVAEQVWDATQVDKVHRPVGRESKMIRFVAAHFPGLMMKRARKSFGPDTGV
jgi:NADP-dependent 3-hydroxy acid dehydrogenase YdfG